MDGVTIGNVAGRIAKNRRQLRLSNAPYAFWFLHVGYAALELPLPTLSVLRAIWHTHTVGTTQMPTASYRGLRSQTLSPENARCRCMC
jgi:hypothetical protein